MTNPYYEAHFGDNAETPSAAEKQESGRIWPLGHEKPSRHSGQAVDEPTYFAVAQDPECYATTEADDVVEAWKELAWSNPDDAPPDETAAFTEFARNLDNWQMDDWGKPAVLVWDVGGESNSTITFYRLTHRDRPQPSGQAVDRQEWTDHHLHELVMDLRVAIGKPEDIHRTFIGLLRPWFNKHIAALAAERQRREKDETDIRAQIIKEVEQEYFETRQQLLSALAAIEKLNLAADREANEGSGASLAGLYKAVANMRNIDLSPLHRHDAELTEKVRAPLLLRIATLNNEIAEVSKPLVEAIRKAHGQLNNIVFDESSLLSVVNQTLIDALAKVKEKP